VNGATDLERLPSLDDAEGDWRALAPQTENVFASWEWGSIWWRHFGEGREPLVTRCSDENGNVVALLPLYLWRKRPIRVARFIGHGPADQLGPLCSKDVRTTAAVALRRVLAAERCEVFVGDTLDRSERWAQLLEAKVYGRGSSPVLRLEWETWDDFLATRSANFRSQLRRRERALRKLGARPRLCDDREALDRDLDTFFALHHRRWQSGGSNVVRLTGFHREFAACAFDRGWLRLWFLEIDGEAVAAWYGLRYGTTESYYQAGRDPAWDRLAVGFVLLAHSVREALADGMDEYRFGRGGQHYKTRFGPEDEGFETIVLTRGAAGSAAMAGVGAVRRVRRRLRRMQAPAPRRPRSHADEHAGA
jgi:CelD/BcsL family acetyltransferase involved in cellulose biosynthesis